MSSLKIKVLLISQSSVGKIVDRVVNNKFQADYKLTIGVDILSKDVEFGDGEIATLSIWDIGGQQRFETFRSTFYKGAAGVLIFFNLTNRETYEEAKRIYGEIKEVNSNIPFILIGDNVNLVKSIDSPNLREEARKFALDEEGIYIEISQNNVDILEEAISELTHRIIKDWSE